MYDWEIKEYLQNCNYFFENHNDFYDRIVKTSPQIKRIKLEEIQLEKSKYYIELQSGDNYFIWIKNQGNTK